MPCETYLAMLVESDGGEKHCVGHTYPRLSDVL